MKTRDTGDALNHYLVRALGARWPLNYQLRFGVCSRIRWSGRHIRLVFAPRGVLLFNDALHRETITCRREN